MKAKEVLKMISALGWKAIAFIGATISIMMSAFCLGIVCRVIHVAFKFGYAII